jgi:hypothetical protein
MQNKTKEAAILSGKDPVERVYDSMLNGQHIQAVDQLMQDKIELSDLAHALIAHSEFKDGITISLSKLLFVAYHYGYADKDNEEEEDW